jgi:hypothetical protein
MLISNKNFISEYFIESTKSNGRGKDFEVGIKKKSIFFSFVNGTWHPI